MRIIYSSERKGNLYNYFRASVRSERSNNSKWRITHARLSLNSWKKQATLVSRTEPSRGKRTMPA